MDARHDRLGVLSDLVDWWPKLRQGGIMAGHDYTMQKEPQPVKEIPHFTQRGKDPSWSQDWTRNFDGTIDKTGRTVKGAVDDFFGGESRPPYESPPELKRCPRQLSITYRELGFNTWYVAK